MEQPPNTIIEALTKISYADESELQSLINAFKNKQPNDLDWFDVFSDTQAPV